MIVYYQSSLFNSTFRPLFVRPGLQGSLVQAAIQKNGQITTDNSLTKKHMGNLLALYLTSGKLITHKVSTAFFIYTWICHYL